ncbi:TPR domain protein [hydrothermal vent metagenome]|uniref:TPR domain protein n=1 Tax=hydrothermal vent metagenome TaxID=652676 RepID=A0A3B1DJE5_9ZZZZ
MTTLVHAQKLLQAGRPTEAEPILRALLAHTPPFTAADIPVMLALSTILEIQNNLDEMIALLRALLELDPASPTALGTLARALRTQGHYDEALAVLQPLANTPATPEAALALCPIYLSLKRNDDCRQLAEAALASPGLPPHTRATLGFHLGQALHNLGEYDLAFPAFKRANESLPRSFRRQHILTLYQGLRTAFSADRLATAPHATLDASNCLFIVGMPRSGTTLIEQIIDAHPLAHGCGELPDIRHIAAEFDKALGNRGPAAFADLTPKHLDHGARTYLDRMAQLAPEAAIVTNKLPHNFELLGLINRMLPGARVIHCRRNPLDTCLSCYFTNLGPAHSYATDLADLAFAYAQYTKLMRHWQAACDLPILDVQYEALVAETETFARNIIEFVGLPWDDRCLRFYETSRAVATASVDQVRSPIYTSSVARWKRYDKHLDPLLTSLRTAGVELPD